MTKGLQDLLDKYGKHCPECGSGQITTLNNAEPLRHRCLDCEHEFFDKDAVIGKR